MAYKALYRTYRPQSFSDVIGQDIIVRTLQNEIKENKISHAYIFSGPRGTGKTSIARVFAKTLNCPSQKDQEPCNNCSTCNEITEGNSPDVIEIDAASNNGVDEIRDIKDKIKFLPAGAKYKIYIIDEVHMLSTSAFNALLKTLEEPPKHVIFILATTEPHKILPTVLSRCQRYDFKALTIEEILAVLKGICEKENVKFEEEALRHIASASSGGLRDAISFLDQAISLSDEKITDEDAASVTGTVGKEKLNELVWTLKEKKLIDALNIIRDLQNSGKEVNKIVIGLLEFYRDVLMYNSLPSEEFNEKQKQFASTVTNNELFYYIDVLNDVQAKIKFTTTPAIFLEVAIIKIIQSSPSDFDYKKRIDDLETKLLNVGSLDIGSSSDVTSKRMDKFEEKYNNLLAYLAKLELPKVNDRIKNLEQNKQTGMVGTSSLSINKEFELRVNKAIEDLELLKITQNSLRNEVENQKTGGISEDDVISKIEEMVKKVKPSINYSEIEDFVKKQEEYYLNKMLPKALETATIPNQVQTETTNIVSPELEDRISKIESNIYKLMSGTLYTQSTTSRKSKQKVDDKQLSFWKGDVIEVDKIATPSTNTKTNFDQSLMKENKNNDQKDTSNINDKDISTQNTEIVDNKENTINISNINENEESTSSIISNEINDDKDIDVLDALEGTINYFDDSLNDKEIQNNQIEVERNQTEEKRKSEFEEQVKLALEQKKLEAEKELERKRTEELERKRTEELERKRTEELERKRAEELERKRAEERKRLEDEQKRIEEEQRRIEAERKRIEEEKKRIENESNVDVGTELETTNSQNDLDLLDDYDEYERYDVKILERILNDSRTQDASERERMANLWNHLISLAPAEKRGVAEILSEGEVKAVGNHEFVILYPNSAICNQVMSRRFKRSSLKLLYDLLDGDYNYLALPQDTWIAKRQEYAAQYLMGTKYPKLKPFDDPSLRINNNDEYDDDEGMVKKVLDIFGDTVKIKRRN